MAKSHTFRKTKPGKPIPVTARQLESFMLEHNGKFNSRDYDKFERMELMESPVCDAIHELKTYSLETLAQRFDVRLFGRGKRVFARLDAEDDKWYYFSLAYIPRALNNRDVNDAIEATIEKHELLGQKTQKQRKIDDLAEKYAELDKESPKAVKDKLKKDMADLQNDVVNIDERIKQIEAKIKNPEKIRMTIEKFSNSLNSLINRLEKEDLVEKDILVRNIV